MDIDCALEWIFYIVLLNTRARGSEMVLISDILIATCILINSINCVI